jgi:transposase
VAFYTDKASLFQTAPKVARNAQALPREEREPMPPTQIGRALRELGIGWQAAHSPQAKALSNAFPGLSRNSFFGPGH